MLEITLVLGTAFAVASILMVAFGLTDTSVKFLSSSVLSSKEKIAMLTAVVAIYSSPYIAVWYFTDTLTTLCVYGWTHIAYYGIMIPAGILSKKIRKSLESDPLARIAISKFI